MLLENLENFGDYELLDTGAGLRLERWAEVRLSRPDPQIIWPKSLPEPEWQKVRAAFKSLSQGEKGAWQIYQTLPDPWLIRLQGLKLKAKLTPFKHTGIFPEQAAQWKWMAEKISASGGKEKGPALPAGRLRILNLFAYTGGATIFLAKLGCFLTHVDASLPSIKWAKENHLLNNLPSSSIRWMLDDAVKFVKRELKREQVYDGIIMDPPAFGHGPSGKTWKFNQHLPGLLADCVKLLGAQAKFLVINGYATNSSALALHHLLQDALAARPGEIEFGELCLPQKNAPRGAKRLISTGIFARWSS